MQASLVGCDRDRLAALTCRLEIVLQTETLYRDRLAELAARWQQTEGEHGAARSAEQARHAALAAELRSLEKSRIPMASDLAMREKAAHDGWYRCYLWIRNLQGDMPPAARIQAVEAARAALAAHDNRTRAVQARAEICGRELRRLSAPFEDIDFARTRMAENLGAALDERRTLEQSIRDLVTAAIVDRPVWALIQTAAEVQKLDPETLFELRRALRPQLARAIDAPTDCPQPMPPADVIAAAVKAGFVQRHVDGSGSVTVSGSGSTDVRRTRWVTDHQGKRRHESYTVSVSVQFHGSVTAGFTVNYHDWRPAKLAHAAAKQVQQDLDTGHLTVSAQTIAAPEATAALRRLLDLCGFPYVPETA